MFASGFPVVSPQGGVAVGDGLRLPRPPRFNWDPDSGKEAIVNYPSLKGGACH